MATINTLPELKLKGGYCNIESGLDDSVRFVCKYLELPLKLSDKTVVKTFNHLHAQSTIGKFIKFNGKPYCKMKPKDSNFYIVIRRGSIDYKLTARDFRLEILRMRGVLK